jgi:hypothetical protein
MDPQLTMRLRSLTGPGTQAGQADAEGRQMTFDNDKLSGIRDRIGLDDPPWSGRRRRGLWIGLAVILGLIILVGGRVFWF